MNMQGFVDLHTHGLADYDTLTDDHETILSIARLHARAGTVAIVPAIYSGHISEMRRNLKALSRAMQAQAKERGLKAGGSRCSAQILGAHLEGPFLNPARCGALDKNSFIKPTLSALKRLVAGYEDIIKIITIAPEIPGALKVIEKCRDMGIRVNMGHSDATLSQAYDAKKAGATGITHIFNAMRPFHHREPGIAGLGLIDRDLYIEVIADGLHLHPSMLELIFRCKQPDRIVLVSDSVRGQKTGRGGIYADGLLRGSGLTLKGMVKRLMQTKIPEADIIRACIDNPLRHINMTGSASLL